MHGLHNADLIRQRLPRHHWAPKPYLPDRKAAHREFAAKARSVGSKKREETAAKAAATRARKRGAATDEIRAGQALGTDSASALAEHTESTRMTIDDEERSLTVTAGEGLP